MRTLIALTCTVPVLLATTATVATATVAERIPAKLERGLPDAEDLPKGFRLGSDSRADSSYFFTESSCAGGPQRFGTERARAVHRSFATGDGASTVEMVIGLARGQDLARVLRTRLTDCPGADKTVLRRPVAALTIPDLGITTEGVVYTDDRAESRAVAVYRDVTSEIRVRHTGTADTKRLLTAWLSGLITLYHSPARLARAMPVEGQLPEVYTRTGGSDDRMSEIKTFGSDLCGGAPATTAGPLTVTWRDFEAEAGATLEVRIASVGATRARRIVTDLAAIPQRCPVHPDGKATVRHERLDLPVLHGPAAGVVTVHRDSDGFQHRMHAAALAYGDVLMTFEERGTDDIDRARFLRIVEEATGNLGVIGKP